MNDAAARVWTSERASGTAHRENTSIAVELVRASGPIDGHREYRRYGERTLVRIVPGHHKGNPAVEQSCCHFLGDEQEMQTEQHCASQNHEGLGSDKRFQSPAPSEHQELHHAHHKAEMRLHENKRGCHTSNTCSEVP